MVTIFRGNQNVARIQTAGLSNIKSGRSEIVMEGGTVRKVNLPTIGVSLHYAAHSRGHRAAPQEPQLAQVVPVATEGAGR